ncbi:hypothetical protein ACIGXM_35065 [Kitasatospora sp. NPDC052896]|uniref:scabin-related ADP-ribosyltransferase n=1 Tax=Kitasatospora sp. NPDC052896 TaxID=3364061 RepID=UPI0037C8F457
MGSPAMLNAALRVLAVAALATASLTVVSPAQASPDGLPLPRAIAGPDTGPCGPVGEFRPQDWWRTTTTAAISDEVDHAALTENWRWREDTNSLWRGDAREDVRQLFENGFTPRGSSVTPLSEYVVRGGGQDTAHLSTSCERWVAQKSATRGPARTGWVYEIEAPGGIDVNATARVDGYRSPYLWNKEIDFPGGIEGRYIKQACKYHLIDTDPATKINSYENLGCRTNQHFQPVRTGYQPAVAGASR